MKSLADISWNIPEPEYRQDPALSQSTLAKYEREGFAGLDTLFDHVDTPSLTFGSIVDCLVTDGEDAFNKQYIVSDIPSMEPAVEPIVKEIYQLFHNSYTDINDIPDASLLPTINEFGYQPRWKPDTRCKVVREKGQQYYQTMFMAGDKKIITQDVYNKAFACVRALKDSPQTYYYFMEDNPFDSVQRFYQLKFKQELNGITYRGMADLLIVDHERKMVIPCDLKTSASKEYEFYKSFVKWQYAIQARLYWRLIRKTMDQDEYFKDFELRDFRFIVVNNNSTPNPLVWEFDQTKTKGEIVLGNIKMRDPEVIGEELTNYLQEKPEVPTGVKIKGVNNLSKWIAEM